MSVGLAHTDPATQKTTAPTGPGTFIVSIGVPPSPPSSDGAAVGYVELDGSCQPTAKRAESGTVTITAVDGEAYSGTGDVTFLGGDHITFQFAANACASFATVGTSAIPATCM